MRNKRCSRIQFITFNELKRKQNHRSEVEKEVEEEEEKKICMFREKFYFTSNEKKKKNKAKRKYFFMRNFFFYFVSWKICIELNLVCWISFKKKSTASFEKRFHTLSGTLIGQLHWPKVLIKSQTNFQIQIIKKIKKKMPYHIEWTKQKTNEVKKKRNGKKKKINFNQTKSFEYFEFMRQTDGQFDFA